MPTKLSKRSSTLLALICLVMGLLAFLIFVSTTNSSQGFWTGFAITVLSTILLGATSYHKASKEFSEQDLTNIGKTLKSLQFMRKIFWLWFPAIIIVQTFFDHDFNPVIMGIGVGAFLSVSSMILLDNFIFHKIFLWNNNNPNVKAIYSNDPPQI